jgi:hypothetical protein
VSSMSLIMLSGTGVGWRSSLALDFWPMSSPSRSSESRGWRRSGVRGIRGSRPEEGACSPPRTEISSRKSAGGATKRPGPLVWAPVRFASLTSNAP